MIWICILQQLLRPKLSSYLIAKFRLAARQDFTRPYQDVTLQLRHHDLDVEVTFSRQSPGTTAMRTLNVSPKSISLLIFRVCWPTDAIIRLAFVLVSVQYLKIKFVSVPEPFGPTTSLPYKSSRLQNPEVNN